MYHWTALKEAFSWKDACIPLKATGKCPFHSPYYYSFTLYFISYLIRDYVFPGFNRKGKQMNGERAVLYEEKQTKS